MTSRPGLPRMAPLSRPKAVRIHGPTSVCRCGRSEDFSCSAHAGSVCFSNEEFSFQIVCVCVTERCTKVRSLLKTCSTAQIAVIDFYGRAGVVDWVTGVVDFKFSPTTFHR